MSIDVNDIIIYHKVLATHVRICYTILKSILSGCPIRRNRITLEQSREEYGDPPSTDIYSDNIRRNFEGA